MDDLAYTDSMIKEIRELLTGARQRVTLNNTHYYVDMVFYNKILRAYVLIELKTKSLFGKVFPVHKY